MASLMRAVACASPAPAAHATPQSIQHAATLTHDHDRRIRLSLFADNYLLANGKKAKLHYYCRRISLPDRSSKRPSIADERSASTRGRAGARSVAHLSILATETHGATSTVRSILLTRHRWPDLSSLRPDGRIPLSPQNALPGPDGRQTTREFEAEPAWIRR